MGRDKMLFLLPWLGVGGAENFVLRLARYMRERGMEVHVIAASPSKDVAGEAVEKYEAFTPFVFELPNFLRQEFWMPFTVDYISGRQIDRVFIAGCRLVYAHLPEIKKRHPEVRIYDQLFNDSPLGHAEINRCYHDYIDKTFVVAEKIRKLLLHTYGGDPGKIRTIYHGVDTNLFNPARIGEEEARDKLGIPRGKRVILYAGRMSVEKNPFLFLDLAAEFNGDDSCFFVLAGDGPLLAEVKKRASSMKLGNIIFLGLMEPGDMPVVYRAADLLVVTSEVEGIPLTIYEALAMGVPVVASDVGGISDVVENAKNGYLFRKGREDDLLSNVKKALQCSFSGLREKVIGRYEFSVTVRRYFDVIEGDARSTTC